MILQSLGVATGSGSDVLDAASLIGNIVVCGLGRSFSDGRHQAHQGRDGARVICVG